MPSVSREEVLVRFNPARTVAGINRDGDSTRLAEVSEAFGSPVGTGAVLLLGGAIVFFLILWASLAASPA